MKFYLDCFEIFYPNNKRTTFPLQNGDYVLVHYETKEEGKPWTIEGENITVLCKYKITPGTTMGGAHATLFSEGSPWFIRKHKKEALSHEV